MVTWRCRRGSIGLKIAIVDDNKPDLKLLGGFIAGYCRENRVDYELAAAAGGGAFLHGF